MIVNGGLELGKTIELYRTKLAVFHQAMLDYPRVTIGDQLELPGCCLSLWRREKQIEVYYDCKSED